MEQLTKNQAVATSQEAVQNQNEPQLRDENAHNDKSVHGVLNPTYQAGLRRDAVQPDIEAERKKRDEIEAGRSEERFSRNADTDLVCRLLLEKKNCGRPRARACRRGGTTSRRCCRGRAAHVLGAGGRSPASPPSPCC